MSQAEPLVVAAGATMALMLASRALRASQLSLRTKLVMALVWAALIVAGAAIAAWWQH